MALHRRVRSAEQQPGRVRSIAQPSICVIESDYRRLRSLADGLLQRGSRENNNARRLAEELDCADVLEAKAIPSDLIILDSVVRLKDLDSGKILTYTLVMPGQADIDLGRISVLAPVGTAMLGYRAGDTFEWNVPGGVRRFRVEKVRHKPETAAYHA